jgi:regulator of protease activity HflC (stomatin/prohibitin superfamily)
VQTQKITGDTISASKDLQEVKTQVALNYYLEPENVQVLYQRIGLDYANRIIIPAIQESVKQVAAKFNAEELITKREMVKNEIEEQIRARLAAYNIAVDTISITEFQFLDEFVKAEAKVAAQQRALQAQNELRRVEVEAQQAEARAVGEQKANIAKADGVRQTKALPAQGEAQAITIIDQQHKSPSYLGWLNTQKWNGQLPLVVGGEGKELEADAEQNMVDEHQIYAPFISIPTGRSIINQTSSP